jgi:hypothetical protein
VNFILDPGLALYLPLQELAGSSFMSRDAFGHLCTVTGALWRPDGRYFDGVDDKITVPAHSSIALNNGFTVELWVNVVAWQDWDCLYGKQSDDNNKILLYERNDGTFRFLVKSGGVTQADLSFGICPVGIFHHLTVTASGNGDLLAGYQNADLIATDTAYVLPDTSANDFIIGARGDGTFNANCVISEFRIYKRALTFPEIQRNYLATKWRYQ